MGETNIGVRDEFLAPGSIDLDLAVGGADDGQSHPLGKVVAVQSR